MAIWGGVAIWPPADSMHLGAGLACDPSGITAGYAAGYVGYAVRLRLFPFAAVTDKPPHLNIVRPSVHTPANQKYSWLWS